MSKRGNRIAALEFSGGAQEADREPDVERRVAGAEARSADSKTGQLRLRVVDGEEA